MQRIAVLTGLVLLVAVGCSSSSDTGEDASGSSTTAAEAVTSTSVVQMTFPDSTMPTTTAGDTSAAGDAGATSPTGTGQIIMLKLHVGDVDAAETFYTSVFGATPVPGLGDLRVLTMEEGPGFILLGEDPGDEDEWNGSFLIQVPDLEVAEAAAIEAGATRQQAFEGNPGGQQARSVDLLDPWGNQIEILQLD